MILDRGTDHVFNQHQASVDRPQKEKLGERGE